MLSIFIFRKLAVANLPSQAHYPANFDLQDKKSVRMTFENKHFRNLKISRMKKYEVSKDTLEMIENAIKEEIPLKATEISDFINELHDPDASGPIVNNLQFAVALRQHIELASGINRNARKSKTD